MNNSEKVAYIHTIRQADFDVLVNRAEQYIINKDALEIGSGTGYQLSILKKICRSAKGIDLKSGPYSDHQAEDILEYDGRNIPFFNQTFDIIFSSNVLEHVDQLDEFHEEMKRVLKSGGVAIHIIPSHHWRLWSVLTFYPALILNIYERLVHKNKDSKGFGVGSSQKSIEATESKNLKSKILLDKVWARCIPHRHGERGNVVTEMRYFHPSWWKREFTVHAWNLVECYPTGIFHSGNQILGNRLSILWRKKISTIIGSSTYTYILKKQ